MSKAIRASALVLLLACSAQAGWIQNGSPAPPQSQPGWIQNESPAPAVQEPTADGIIPNDAAAGWIQNDATATFAQVLLNLLALS